MEPGVSGAPSSPSPGEGICPARAPSGLTGVLADKAGLCLLISNPGLVVLQFNYHTIQQSSLLTSSPQIIALGTEIPVRKQQILDRDVDLVFKMLSWGLECPDQLLRRGFFQECLTLLSRTFLGRLVR